MELSSPPSIMARLQALGENVKIPYGLNTFIGKAEIPRELPSWRDQIGDNLNPGLALRWVGGITEIESTLQIPEKTRTDAMKTWRERVIEVIGTYDNLSYFSEAEDTPSIVSLRILHPESQKFMKKSELAKVFLNLTLEQDEKFPAASMNVKNKCFTGQPVLINENEAVLRIALGSDSLKDIINDMENTLKQDF